MFNLNLGMFRIENNWLQAQNTGRFDETQITATSPPIAGEMLSKMSAQKKASWAAEGLSSLTRTSSSRPSISGGPGGQPIGVTAS